LTFTHPYRFGIHYITLAANLPIGHYFPISTILIYHIATSSKNVDMIIWNRHVKKDTYAK